MTVSSHPTPHFSQSQVNRVKSDIPLPSEYKVIHPMSHSHPQHKSSHTLRCIASLRSPANSAKSSSRDLTSD